MKSQLQNEILTTLSSLPELPGVYRFFDIDDKLLYIGKAKNIKKRVSSYFHKVHDSGKLRVMVSKICRIEHIVVDTESEALLLENSLIKEFQPRYNVLLKDDKTFPWVVIKKERFPRVFYTRNVVKDGSSYFGPFASVRLMKTLLDMIKQLYKLRTCNHNLSKDNISKNKFKVCLDFHIGTCKAPCIGKQDDEDYATAISEIKNILRGDLNSVTMYLHTLMKKLAGEYNFEGAQQVKERIEILEKFQKKSVVVNPSINNVDVFSIISEDSFAYVNYIKVINGAIIQGHTVELKKQLDETERDLLLHAIIDIRQRFESNSREIIVPFDPEINLKDADFTVPQRGDKKKLLDLSMRNAAYFRQEKLLQAEKLDPMNKVNRVLEKMKSDLRLPELPVHIECFDNSNIQGANPVAACVVFKNTKPSKKDYRHFNVKTVTGPDDFATMEEIITRRYTRIIDEGDKLPQLVVIDGGKGQLGVAVSVFEKLGIRGKVSVIGIAKKLEEIYFPGDSIPVYIDKNSETLKVIQHIRNEAHRFGITFHRNKRSKDFLKSELDQIEGIGEKTKQQLLSELKSIENIRNASVEILESFIGKSKAAIIVHYFSNKKGAETI